MQSFNEAFLHFLWKNQELKGVEIIPVNGISLEVIHPGETNPDAGPDFFNAQVRLDGTLWAGNVEIHINASDWLKHGHTGDSSYDSVILHVVYYHDCDITRSGNEIIPAALIRFVPGLLTRYHRMLDSASWLPCDGEIRSVPPVIRTQTLSSLLVEKWEKRCSEMQTQRSELNNHWEALLHRQVCRGFGVPVNTVPFEMLATLIPVNELIRIKTDLFSLEAMLFGQAGMLDTIIPEDIYMESLVREYRRIGNRLDNNRVPSYIWKSMRMRPSSFPTIRIAQLAAFIQQSYPLMRWLKKRPTLEEWTALCRVRCSDYWNNHYRFGKPSGFQPKKMGIRFIQGFLVNTIAPFSFYFGKQMGEKEYTDYAIALMEDLPPEKNSVTDRWRKNGLNAENAFESQSILYLYKQYCKAKRCLECQIGNYVILHGKEDKS